MNYYMIGGIIAAAVLLVIIFIVVVLLVLKGRKKSEVPEKKSYYQSAMNDKESLGKRLRRVFGGKSIHKEELLELEETLIHADIGPAITAELIDGIQHKKISTIDEAIEFLKKELQSYFTDKEFGLAEKGLNVVLVLGVNGVGKTTSIAKLANLYLLKGKKVLLAAGDTFRAAASEQLATWAGRLSVPVIKQGEGADSASVVFDAIDAAKAKGVDLLLVDTAGRLHNKKNLVEELKKIEGIIRKKDVALQKNLLVLDSTTGQNAFIQAETFHKAIGIDGIVLTKYDAQTKGGIVFTIEKKLGIPFLFVGTGEQLENIGEFNKSDFIHKIFD